MRISLTSDYAVRACVALAAVEPGLLTTADTLAEAQDIPRPYLLTILSTLKRHGILESKRGVDGGYRLARPGDEITVADVMRAIDGPLADVGGQLVEDVAYRGVAVPLRDTWVALRVAIRSVLEEVTIQALADNKLPQIVKDLTRPIEAWQTRAAATPVPNPALPRS